MNQSRLLSSIIKCNRVAKALLPKTLLLKVRKIPCRALSANFDQKECYSRSGPQGKFNFHPELVSAKYGVLKAYKDFKDEELTWIWLKNIFHVSCTCYDEKSCDEDVAENFDKMDMENNLLGKANSDVEKVLVEVEFEALEATERELQVYADAIKLFLDKGYHAIGEKSASQHACSWYGVGLVTNILSEVEETLFLAEQDLVFAKAEMESLKDQSDLMEQYKCQIKAFRKKIEDSLDGADTPDGKKCNHVIKKSTGMVSKLTYDKVMNIQKELAMHGIKLYPALCYKEEIKKADQCGSPKAQPKGDLKFAIEPNKHCTCKCDCKSDQQCCKTK